MSNTLYPPPRTQSVGEILDSAFRIFRATLVQCLPYAIAAVIAGQLPNIYYLVSGRNMLQGLAGFRDPVWLTLYILGYVIAIVLWSAVLLRQYALSTGHPAETSSELSTAVRRVPAMALLGILTGCAVAVWFLPTLALQGTARLVTALVLAIPACYLVVALSCGGAVLLVAGRGPLAGLVHSFRLTCASSTPASMSAISGSPRAVRISPRHSCRVSTPPGCRATGTRPGISSPPTASLSCGRS